MRRKLCDYFLAGIPVVWFINRRTLTAEVYTSPETRTRLGQGDSLEGGDVIPGFTLPLTEFFEVLAD